MLYPSPQEWKAWGITNQLHQLFALHWAELFDNDTPDTWQVRTCNIRTILEELIEAARTAERIETYRNVLRSLLDEAFNVVRHDAVVSRFYPFVLPYLETWRRREIAVTDAGEIGQIATVVLGNLEGYRRRAIDLVLEMLAEADEKRKLDLYAATMTLAIEIVNRGHSPDYIRNLLLKRVLGPQSDPFCDRVAAMLDLLSRDHMSYTCTFIPRGIKRVVDNILPTDITLRLGQPANLTQESETTFYSRGNQNTVYMSIRVSAVDQEAARHAAEQRLFQFFSGLTLYGVEDPLGLKHVDALVETDNGTKWLIGKPGDITYLNNTKQMYKKTGMLLRVHDRLSQDDAAQLMAALQYHRLALTATSDEARFINLWVALESLCQGGTGSIIERVCSRISPCVSINNIKKTVAALAKYIRFLWGDDDSSQFMTLFPNSKPTTLRQEDLLQVLLLKPETPELKELCNLTSRHTLICHRLFRVKTRLLDCPKSIAANMRYTQQNVVWQLKRIYRVRNEIVHKGSSSPRTLRQLTQNLHTYLVTTMQGIIFELDRQPKWSLRDALEHKRRLFDHMVHFFDSTDGKSVSQQALLNPMICLETQKAPFAWE